MTLIPPNTGGAGTPIYDVSAYDPPRNVSFYITSVGYTNVSDVDNVLALLKAALLADGYQGVTVNRYDETSTPI